MTGSGIVIDFRAVQSLNAQSPMELIEPRMKTVSIPKILNILEMPSKKSNDKSTKLKFLFFAFIYHSRRRCLLSTEEK